MRPIDKKINRNHEMELVDYRQAVINEIEVPVAQMEVTVGSVKTTYLSAGVGDTVICLHGGGGGALAWYPTISALAEHFNVIAPHIVGYGESDKPNAPYDRPYFSAWLKDFFSALNISKAHIIGISLGGAIALQFALDHRDMVEKLVLVASGALGARPSLGSFFAMWWLNSIPSALAHRFMLRYLLVKEENINSNYGNYSLQALKKLGGQKAFIQGKGAAMLPISKEELQKINNQTLIIWGENDNLFSISHGEVAAFESIMLVRC